MKFKKIIGYILLIVLSQNLFSNDLTAYLYMAQFKSPNNESYIETYLNIIGNTVSFRKDSNGTYQSKIQILFLFKQNGKIITYEKYNLKSPNITDSISNRPNYIDVQRIPIKNGIYNFEIKIQDLYDSTNTFTYNNIITIKEQSKNLQFSDIEIIDNYKETTEENILSKNGLDLVPYVSSFFSNNKDSLIFYSELYNKGDSEDFILQYYIKNQDNNTILQDYFRSKRITAQNITPILSLFDITKLATGNYNLVLDIKNRDNKNICQKKFFFQRYNNKIAEKSDTIYLENIGLVELKMITDINIIKDYIKSLIPILNQRELYKANNILKSKDIDLMKNFFDTYWQSTSKNPEQEWNIYKKNVQLVNRSYTSQIKKGYETDRGVVYLKYGTPSNIITNNHEPSTYPYEIWNYFELNGETNRHFVFYNPDIAGEDYQLLHSDVTGELNNPYWQKDLTKRNSTRANNWDETQGQKQYGNRSLDMYNR